MMNPCLSLFLCVLIVVSLNSEPCWSKSTTDPEMTSKLLCELLCEHCNGVSNMVGGQCICEVPMSHFKDNVACLERVQLSAAEMNLPLNHTAKIGARRRRHAAGGSDTAKPEEFAESLDDLRLKYSTTFSHITSTSTSPTITDSTTDSLVNQIAEKRGLDTLEISPASLHVLRPQTFVDTSSEIVDNADKHIARRTIQFMEKERTPYTLFVTNENSVVPKSKPSLLPIQNPIFKYLEDSERYNQNFRNSLKNNLNSLLEKSPYMSNIQNTLNLSKARNSVQPDILEADSLDNIRSKLNPISSSPNFLPKSQNSLKLHDILTRQRSRIPDINFPNLNKINDLKLKLLRMFSTDNLRESRLSQDIDNYLPLQVEGLFLVGSPNLNLNSETDNSKGDEIQRMAENISDEKPAGSILAEHIKRYRSKLNEFLGKNKFVSPSQLARNMPENVSPQIKSSNTVPPSIYNPVHPLTENTNRNKIDCYDNKEPVQSRMNLDDKLNTYQGVVHSNPINNNNNEQRYRSEQNPVYFSNARKALENPNNDKNLWIENPNTNEVLSNNLEFGGRKSGIGYLLHPTYQKKLVPPVIQVKPIEYNDRSPVFSKIFPDGVETLISPSVPLINSIQENIFRAATPLEKQIFSNVESGKENQLGKNSKSSSDVIPPLNPAFRNKGHSPLTNRKPMNKVDDNKINNPLFDDKKSPHKSPDVPKLRMREENLSDTPEIIENQDGTKKNVVLKNNPDLGNLGSGQNLMLVKNAGTPLTYIKSSEPNDDPVINPSFTSKAESLISNHQTDIPDMKVQTGNIPNTESIERRPNENSLATGSESNGNGMLLRKPNAGKLDISSEPKSIDQYENNEDLNKFPLTNDMQSSVACPGCFKHQPTSLETSPEAENYVVQDIRGPSTFPFQLYPGQHPNGYARIDHGYSPPGYGLVNPPSYYPNNMQRVEHVRPFDRNEFLPFEQSPRLIPGHGGVLMNGLQADPYFPHRPGVFVLSPVGHVPISQLIGQLGDGEAIVELHPLQLQR